MVWVAQHRSNRCRCDVLSRAILIWMSIVPVAIVNGIVRDVALVPYLGDPVGRAISCLTLGAAILVVGRISIRWIGPLDAIDAWTIGLLWLGLTLAFEFLAGHFVFRTPWETLIADYNVLEGRLWIVVLIAALIAPPLTFRAAHFP